MAATGPFQKPLIPQVVPDDLGIVQMHSTGYRNPAQLPDGAVMVVGSGASGTQIADELLRSGRKVYLVATHAHPEHDLGAQSFPAGTTMVHDLVRGDVEFEDVIFEYNEDAPVLKGVIRVTFWGAAAMAITAGVGLMFGVAA